MEGAKALSPVFPTPSLLSVSSFCLCGQQGIDCRSECVSLLVSG